MSVEKYDEYVNNLKLKLEKCMEDIKTDNKKYPSISDVKANDELNEFDIYCKKRHQNGKKLFQLLSFI